MIWKIIGVVLVLLIVLFFVGIMYQNVPGKPVKMTVEGIEGEEFSIILPETPKKRAVGVAERICREIAATIVETGDAGDLRITVSMGVATYPNDADSVQLLIREADKALYAAKEEGKNRVVQAPSLESRKNKGK